MKKLLTLCLFLLPLVTNARKFYVSSTGSDSYTITQAQNPNTPWATLSKVQSSLSSFTSGDSILFKKGDKFSGSINIQSKTGMFFGSYGLGAKPLFWGNGATISALFRVRTCTSMVFRGLSVSDTTISPTDRTVQAKIQNVFVLEASSTGVTIKDITMDRIGYGVYMTRTSPRQTVDSCDIGNLRMIRNTPTSVNPDDDYGGVPIQVSGRNNTITNNYFHDCWSQSFDYGFDGGGIEFFEEGDTISGNIIMYNTFYDNNGTLEHGSNNDGIANNPIQNNIFAYNKVINCSSLFYFNNNGQYKSRLKNLMIYNNVIVQTSSSRTGSTRMISMAIADTTVNIATLKNNIFKISSGVAVARSTVFAGTQLINTNNIYQLTNGSVTNFTLDVTEISITSPIWVDTTNINPLFWNYNLIGSSQAINKGVNVGLNKDFNNQIVNNPPDIGILEYTTILPTPCNFQYVSWGQCINGLQYRDYVSFPDSCVGTPPQDSIQRACTNIAITKFYYDPLRIAIYIESNVSGQMMVTDVLGSFVRRYSYRPNGQWIGLRNFPRGICFASTYGQTITFIR
jgi:hypothetical protein